MALSDVTSAIEEWVERRPGYDLARDYERGNHQLRFATDDFKQKFGGIVQGLRENLCPAVITAHTDKLSIQSWGESIDDADTVGMSRLVGYIHAEAYRCGDAYTLTWKGRDGKPVPHYHRADQIIPTVDDTDPSQLSRAAKIMFDRSVNRWRVNIYDAEKVERWAGPEISLTGPGTETQQVPGDHTKWVPWSDDDGGDTIGHDFGAVPVCWWKVGAQSPTEHGVSVLSDVIPIQDAMNASVAHLVIAGETFARPFWYLLNFVPKDENPFAVAQEFTAALAELQASTEQAARRFDPTGQQIFTHDGPGPFGQLDPPQLDRLTEVQDAFATKISRITGIPLYYLTQTTGMVPSGESLRVLTSRLVSSVRNFQDLSTPVWRGQAKLLGFEDVTPTWADPVPLSQNETVTLVREWIEAGLTLEDALRMAGVQNAEELAANAAAQEQIRAAQRLNDFTMGMDRGQLPL